MMQQMQQEPWNADAVGLLRPTKSTPCSPIKPAAAAMLRTHSDSFHVAHKVPVGDTPYVRAKRVQLVDKDPEKAIALFWSAINAGDRVDSALKDMAIVMKQQNRAEEAIEAIKSLRSRCSDQAQESLDNILLDLYKRCGRLDDQISLLKHKLQLIHQGHAFNGKRTKTARSQGRKFQVTLEQEATRLLGNLGWALMQKENYTEAEGAYRRALLIGPDNNKMCNLGICLMKQGRVLEAKDVLKQVRPAAVDGLRGADSHLKAYERAQEMLRDLETKLVGRPRADQLDTNWLFDALLLGSSSSIWQPQPCIDHLLPPPAPAPAPASAPAPVPAPRDRFADENAGVSKKLAALQANMLNVDAQPFYSLRVPPLAAKPHNTLPQQQPQQKPHNTLPQQQQKPAPVHDPLGNLKRTRSGNCMDKAGAVVDKEQSIDENSGRRKSLSAEDRWPELPDHSAFDEALVAAVHDPLGNLKRTRSGNCMDKAGAVVDKEQSIDENSGRRKSLSAEDRWPELPDHSAFDEALVAAALGPVLDEEPTAAEGIGHGKLPASCDTSPAVKEKIGKRLRIFQDITQTVNNF